MLEKGEVTIVPGEGTIQDNLASSQFFRMLGVDAEDLGVLIYWSPILVPQEYTSIFILSDTVWYHDHPHTYLFLSSVLQANCRVGY